MAEGPIARLETLSQGTRSLAASALQADRRLQGQALAALPDSSLAELRLLTGTHWRWLLEVVEHEGRRFLVWRQRDVRPVLRIGLELALKPVPKDRPPEGAPQLPPVLLERPAILLPSTPLNLQRYVPDDDVHGGNTVLLQLGRDRVLAVRRPDYLLGLVRAKLWWRGRRLKPEDGEWPSEPFLALAEAVSAWRGGSSGTETVPLTARPQDALMQVVAEIVRARHGLQETLYRDSQADSQASEASHLGPLLADQALVHLHADLALRIDTMGDLSDEEDSKTVFVRAHLDFGDGDPSPSHGRLRLDPPDFLASGEVLQSLLSALEDDARRWWPQGLSAAQMRRLLLNAGAPDSGTFALRIQRTWRLERWVIFLSHPKIDTMQSVLRADFRRGPVQEDANHPRLPGAVARGRKVLHRPEHVTAQGGFDDGLVRAFLRLIAALHRYGQAVF